LNTYFSKFIWREIFTRGVRDAFLVFLDHIALHQNMVLLLKDKSICYYIKDACSFDEKEFSSLNK